MQHDAGLGVGDAGNTGDGSVTFTWDPAVDVCDGPVDPPADLPQIPVTSQPPVDVAAAVTVQPAFTGERSEGSRRHRRPTISVPRAHGA